MIDKEIIIGVRRGGKTVSSSEIRQMSGRCGRGYDRPGEVICIVDRNDYDYADECLEGDPDPVVSHLESDLLFHLLPDLIENEGMTLEQIEKWYKRSLCFHQKKKELDLKWYLDEWKETGCVFFKKEKLYPTAMGVLSSRYYIHPENSQIMREKLASFNINCDSLEAIAWLLSFNKIPVDQEEHPEYDEFVSSCIGKGLRFYHDESIESFAVYRVFLPNCPKWIRHVQNSIRKEITRRFDFLEELSRLEEIELPMSLWRIQLSRRVPEELYHLLKYYPDASISVLNELYELNVRDNTLENYDLKYASDNLKKYLYGRRNTEKAERVLSESGSSSSESIEDGPTGELYKR